MSIHYSVNKGLGEQILGSEIDAAAAKKVLRKRLADTAGDDYLNVREKMPSKEAITKYVKRKAMDGVVVQQCVPGNIAPDLATSLIPGAGFLVRFNRVDGRPMLILLDEATIDMLRNATDVLLDGTFEKCPTKNTEYKQIYNIVIVVSDLPYRQQTFLVGAAFLSGKTQAIYVEFFQQLMLLMGNNLGRRKKFHFDFEIGAIRAAEQVFHLYIIQISTCNFHFVKNCIENAKGKSDNGSLRLWRNPEFKDWFRALLGASHLPLNDQINIVNFLLDHPPNLPPDLQQDCARFIAYFRRQWANNLHYVNYWDEGFGGPRTTNGCEGLHSKLNVTIPDKDPTFAKVYTAYRDMFQESVDDYAYIQNKPLEYLKKRKPQYVESESRIIAARQIMLQTLQLGGPVPIENILKYCRHQTYNSCPTFDPAHADAQPPLPLPPNQPPLVVPQLQIQNPLPNPPRNQRPRNQQPQQFRQLNLPHLRFPHLFNANQRFLIPRLQFRPRQLQHRPGRP